MKYAIINSGIVDNIVEWDGSSEFNVDGELIQTDANAKIGGSWDGNEFTFVEPEPEPDTRTYAEKRQAEYPSIDELISLVRCSGSHEKLPGQERSSLWVDTPQPDWKDLLLIGNW